MCYMLEVATQIGGGGVDGLFRACVVKIAYHREKMLDQYNHTNKTNAQNFPCKGCKGLEMK